MDIQRKPSEFLNFISQPGFLVREDRILETNQAAEARLLAPGQAFSPLILGGKEEYEAFREGQLCLTLSIGEIPCSALITRLDQGDLVLLDPEDAAEEFHSMALVSMEMRKPLMQAILSARQAEPGTEVTAKLNQSLMQMLRLVSNMADIGRYTGSARMETRDADSFFRELFEKAAALTEGRTCITYEGIRQPVLTRMDPEQLERAVWNLLSNSLRFLPESGQIHAALTRKGNTLRLTLEDNGSGIADAVRADLFRRYLRQPGIEDSRYGLGLGMAIVRTAAANHGGTLLITTGDTGTRVTMTLAICQDCSGTLRTPLLRPDYTGGWDHGLVELSDFLGPEFYAQL